VELKFTQLKNARISVKKSGACIHYFADSSTFLLFEQRISSFVGAAMKMRLAEEGTWDQRLWQQKCEFC
jgi:hypothetical protein